MFDGPLLRAQKWSTPMCRKSSKSSKRPAWKKELLTKLSHKKEAQTSLVAAGTGDLEGIQRHYKSMQGWG